MKRIHVHVAVKNLGQATGFYSALFATRPAVMKADYAKWMLDEPRVSSAAGRSTEHARDRISETR